MGQQLATAQSTTKQMSSEMEHSWPLKSILDLMNMFVMELRSGNLLLLVHCFMIFLHDVLSSLDMLPTGQIHPGTHGCLMSR